MSTQRGFGRLRASLRSAMDRARLGIRPGLSEHHELERCSLELQTARDSLALETSQGPAGRNAILCGCPRSGTSLLAAALFQPPRMVTVMEPWEGLREPPSDVFRWLREEVRDGRLPNTRLDLDALESEGRVAWTRAPRSRRGVSADSQAIHAVKWPCFWQLLGASTTVKFLVCVRDPAAVVSSMGCETGRLRLGVDYDVPFNRELNQRLLLAHDDDERRRVALYDEVYTHVLRHANDANVMLVQYERWFEEPITLLAEVSAFLDCDLSAPLVRIRGHAPMMRAPGGSDAAEIRAMSLTAAALGYD